MQKAKKELIAWPNALSINNGTKRGYRSKIKINQKHWVYATGTCSLPCRWVTGLRNLFRFSRKSVSRLQLNCPSITSAPIVSLGLFIFLNDWAVTSSWMRSYRDCIADPSNRNALWQFSAIKLPLSLQGSTVVPYPGKSAPLTWPGLVIPHFGYPKDISALLTFVILSPSIIMMVTFANSYRKAFQLPSMVPTVLWTLPQLILGSIYFYSPHFVDHETKV